MDIIHNNLILCHDCACTLVNGEATDERAAEQFEEDMRKWQGYDLVLACDSDDESACESNGWYRCAVCDVRTFGLGHPAVTFRRDDIAYVSRPGDGQMRVVGHDSRVYVGNAAPSLA